jgi:hypothetical protein
MEFLRSTEGKQGGIKFEIIFLKRLQLKNYTDLNN